MSISWIHSRRTAREMAVAVLASSAAVALVASAATTASATGPASGDRYRSVSPIIGGTDTPDDAYPFMAALLKRDGDGAFKHRCGGSLIDPWLVVTAAHCVAGFEPKDLKVAVGRTVLSDARQGQVRDIRASEGKADPGGIIVHPLYKSDSAYDMAVLELDRPVEGIAPIKLPTAGTDALIRPGQQATVTGWGLTDTKFGHTPDRLRQVDVPLLSHNECKVSYSSYNDEVNICAGVEGKDSCNGDSGGPIFRKVPGRQEPIQIGVVSYGEGCAGQGAPGIYTSLSSAKLWESLYKSPEGRRVKQTLGR
ncbi:serine protease [Streptomyces roseoverticillatus]|uniref:S1 family peptidase n=1 Tax=Streptomyces roseoverticillatus TaxID=66429 RepID=UPI00340E01C5